MKRFLILSILIIFLTVSCAGPNKVKVGWTKPDFRQDQFENDCFYYWLRKRIGKDRASWVASTIEKIILIFGRETVTAGVVLK